jgi:proline iminopeptidase
MIRLALALLAAAVPQQTLRSYHDTAAEPSPRTGGVRMVEVATPAGRFRVWTKRIGNNPKVKLLLLHGGPGANHEYFEAFDSFLPQEGIEYIYYDQLGSGNSDKPTDDGLWTLDRFVDELEQVRTALKLDADDFCVLGHSWGGLLAMEYAIRHPDRLKCLVISNMMSSIPAYNDYARRTLMPAMDQAKLKEVQALEAAGRTAEPRYMELLMPLHYEQHVLRRPAAEWPEPVTRSFGKMNGQVYTLMQGPSELGASGRLERWDRFADLGRITVPTLVIAGRHDTMDPAHMTAMAKRLPKGELLMLENGSHLAMYDDQQRYFAGLTAFLHRQEGQPPRR